MFWVSTSDLYYSLTNSVYFCDKCAHFKSINTSRPANVRRTSDRSNFFNTSGPTNVYKNIDYIII